MSGLLFQDTDGAQPAAQAVLAYLRRGFIAPSWCDKRGVYLAQPTVARWHNCREQGYVVSLSAPNRSQINIAFFEHRNSDNICAIVFYAQTLNPPTLSDVPDDTYKTKWDTSHEVRWDQAQDMAHWILETLTAFWVKPTVKPSAKSVTP